MYSLGRYGFGFVGLTLVSATASAAPWELKADVQLPDVPGSETQKVELADLNGDGAVDVVFANCGGDNTGDQSTAQRNQLLINGGGGASFTELDGVFEDPDNAYVIKAADLDEDGDLDLVVGVNFQGNSYLLLNDGGAFTKEPLGDETHSIGDLEIGDVDGDGDLDIFAADWGMNQPYGDPDDQGGAMVLWTGNGDGNFTDASAQLPGGMAALGSWSFDVELVDFDNDYDLDAFISTRGYGKALVFRNDGSGSFENYPVPALQPANGKNVNVAFTPMHLNADEHLDILSLQDGTGGGACIDIEGVQYCAKRNSVLINDGMGQFGDNPGEFWPIAANPPKLDFDAASLDFDSNGTADFVVAGPRQNAVDVNARLLLNNNMKFTLAPAPDDAAFPIVPHLMRSFGLQFADFDGDKKEDVAVAVRDASQPNFVLFGTGVPEDTQAPRIGSNLELLPDELSFGDVVSMRARVHDFKSPTAWHDWQHDPSLGTYNLVDGALTSNDRRLPYLEFAVGLAAPEDILTLTDDDPNKHIAPAVWFGEYLWRVQFQAPYAGKLRDTLTWQFCAIDAAGNKSCVGPFQVHVRVGHGDCGDGNVQEWEQCDDAADGAPCVMCQLTCGDDRCESPGESLENCPRDCVCDNDGTCDRGEDDVNCPSDCHEVLSFCPDGVCNGEETPANCPDDCPPDDSGQPTGGGACCPGDDVCLPDDCCPLDCDFTTGDLGTDGATGELGTDGATSGSGIDESPDDGCFCQGGSRSGVLGLLLLPALFRRRRREASR